MSSPPDQDGAHCITCMGCPWVSRGRLGCGTQLKRLQKADCASVLRADSQTDLRKSHQTLGWEFAPVTQPSVVWCDRNTSWWAQRTKCFQWRGAAQQPVHEEVQSWLSYFKGTLWGAVKLMRPRATLKEASLQPSALTKTNLRAEAHSPMTWCAEWPCKLRCRDLQNFSLEWQCEAQPRNILHWTHRSLICPFFPLKPCEGGSMPMQKNYFPIICFLILEEQQHYHENL